MRPAPEQARMIHIAHTTTPEDIAATRTLLREYIEWALADKDGENAPAFEGVEEELAALPGIYGPPDGRLLLATLDGEPAGTIALRRHDPATGEVKRLYVRPALRGRNVGEMLVMRAVAAAREIGYRRLVLDSHYTMTGAHHLYHQAGFRVVPAPGDFPEHLRPLVVFMEMQLG